MCVWRGGGKEVGELAWGLRAPELGGHLGASEPCGQQGPDLVQPACAHHCNHTVQGVGSPAPSAHPGAHSTERSTAPRRSPLAVAASRAHGSGRPAGLEEFMGEFRVEAGCTRTWRMSADAASSCSDAHQENYLVNKRLGTALEGGKEAEVIFPPDARLEQVANEKGV